MSLQGTLSLDQFQVIKTIGCGAFSHVDLCLHNPTSSICVLKCMSKVGLIEQDQLEHIKNERRIIELAQHPNVVEFYGSFRDKYNVYMMMEFIPGGEVYAHLRTLGQFDLHMAVFYTAEVVMVFEHLHRQKLVYRDLKPENLMFTREGHIKVVDFGFAKHIGNDRTGTVCGTPEYLSPEVIMGKGTSFPADWWALGVLCYEFVVGQSPFFDEVESHMNELICAGEFSFPIGIDATTQAFIRGLLTVDERRRLGSGPTGAAEVKAHPFFEGVDWKKMLAHHFAPPLQPATTEDDPEGWINYPPVTDFELPPPVAPVGETPEMFRDF